MTKEEMEAASAAFIDLMGKSAIELHAALIPKLGMLGIDPDYLEIRMYYNGELVVGTGVPGKTDEIVGLDDATYNRRRIVAHRGKVSEDSPISKEESDMTQWGVIKDTNERPQ